MWKVNGRQTMDDRRREICHVKQYVIPLVV
jgi:hypothetical protein